jgi:hypothetical protein
MTNSWDVIFIAALPLMVSLVTLWQHTLTRRKVNEIRIMVNGRLSQLLEASKGQAHAEGVTAGIKVGTDAANLAANASTAAAVTAAVTAAAAAALPDVIISGPGNLNDR